MANDVYDGHGYYWDWRSEPSGHPDDVTYSNSLAPFMPLTVESIEKACREIEPIAAEIARRLAISPVNVKYLTGNWAVPPAEECVFVRRNIAFAFLSPPEKQAAILGNERTEQPDPSRYPHVCPRCSGPAYVGAIEVDCARGCK